ncbi:MAG: HAMP domain-containing histidine kinase, partial [Ruminococcus sp.]|nr:HAMP domain-containing histidine kinase [Ruminococcus sp.]
MGIRAYVWIYFMVFTILILLLIWLFQYFFLEKYYESAKIRNINKAANDIIDAYGTDKQDDVNRMLAFDNNLCIIITDEMANPLVYENNMGNFSFLSKELRDGYGRYLFDLIDELEDDKTGTITKISRNENFKSREIFYCTKVYTDAAEEQAYLFIESSVEPIDATVSIIREQLIYITIILFELAFIVTIFISKRLSKPIVDITDTAKQFGEGDYSVDFNGTGYLEIEELSKVLNNAKDEIRKVSDLRKDLIANVSHDLRTPLTMVKAYAEMIRDLSGDNPEKRNEHVQIIIDEADRLSALVNNLLELSKLESGNIELKRRDISVVEKLEDCMTRYKLLVEKDGYDIQYI